MVSVLQEQKKLKRDKKIIIIAVIAALIIALLGGTVWYLYRHPYMDLKLSGEADMGSCMIVNATYLGLPMPDDIGSHAALYQETLTSQVWKYRSLYESYDIKFETVIEGGFTTITYKGTGITEDGRSEQVDDTFALPFELYYRML